MRAHPRALLVAAVVVASWAMTACGGHAGADDSTAGTGSTTTAAATLTGPALVARSDNAVDIYTTPDGPADHSLAATTSFGSPRVLLVTADQGDGLEVALPERPNGSTGWIRRSDVEVHQVDLAIEIDLGARTLSLFDTGELVLTTPVAIGKEAAPTPTGTFYVVDKLATEDPGGAYGPFAFGLSAHSEVLTEFAGGDGQVGIHGTNDPSSIGQAVSHGCIRVPNYVAETLNQQLELGTPVSIV
jgi:lipoprotein-anchoring transpeptidase ErfK/SrfK